MLTKNMLNTTKDISLTVSTLITLYVAGGVPIREIIFNLDMLLVVWFAAAGFTSSSFLLVGHVYLSFRTGRHDEGGSGSIDGLDSLTGGSNEGEEEE